MHPFFISAFYFYLQIALKELALLLYTTLYVLKKLSIFTAKNLDSFSFRFNIFINC